MDFPVKMIFACGKVEVKEDIAGAGGIDVGCEVDGNGVANEVGV